VFVENPPPLPPGSQQVIEYKIGLETKWDADDTAKLRVVLAKEKVQRGLSKPETASSLALTDQPASGAASTMLLDVFPMEASHVVELTYKVAK
jgi:hypothetical protein